MYADLGSTDQSAARQDLTPKEHQGGSSESKTEDLSESKIEEVSESKQGEENATLQVAMNDEALAGDGKLPDKDRSRAPPNGAIKSISADPAAKLGERTGDQNSVEHSWDTTRLVVPLSSVVNALSA